MLMLLGAASDGEPKARQVGVIQDDRISEASGVVASRLFEGVFWTHNDGSEGILYAIRRDGSLVGCAKIDAKVHDWEDIATDEKGNLYVSDTGNNADKRSQVNVYRVREPDPQSLKQKHPDKLAVDESWQLELPSERPNIESLFVWRGFGYIIFKQQEESPAPVYRFDLSQPGKSTLEKLTTLPIMRPVTGADIRPDGKELAVLARGALWVFQIDGDVSKVDHGNFTRVNFEAIQSEGVCFADNEIVIVAESREILAVPWKTAPTTNPSKP
jgi:hypothetical protein